jgi:DNA helicase-2/ATP-dependent DNA helicase PcrA
MDYDSLLNDKQLAAVKTPSQYVRIVAGAGSGKTRVLTYRISYLISEMHVDPSRILAIAFTNKVANEMKDRASKLVNGILGYTPNLHISTFHSFCARFLRAECKAINYPSSFTIYDEDDQQRLVKAIAPDLGFRKGDDVVKNALQYIRKKKLMGLYPEDVVIDKTRPTDEKTYLSFYQQYELKKTLSFALDFDDLLLKTIEVLENNGAIRQKWAGRFDYVLVDEFQDTNNTQYKLMKLLLRADTSIYVVGDPDQTIYSWRGANQSIILNFEKEFPNVETVILNENYRSTKTILDAANKLISNNKKRVPKELFTSAGIGDPIEANDSPRPEDEANWVASKIAYLSTHENGTKEKPYFKNIAVLYRSSYMTRPFEAALKDHAIPYQIFGGLRFYERAEVKDLLAYFNLLINSADNVAFERIINTPRRGVGDVSLEKIREEAVANNLSEYDYLKAIAHYQDTTEISPKVQNVLGQLIVTMEKTKADLQANLEAYSSTLKTFATDIGYFEYLKDEEDLEEDRLKNVQALFDDITHFLSNNPGSTFAEYLQNVTLLTSQDDMSGGNFVSLMTIHVAKGLEFDYVFVISMNEGSFPSMRAEAESGRDAQEEERRLAYVAFTRAKKKLFLSCNRGYTYVTDSSSIPSKYFEEAGIKLPSHSEYGSYGNYGDERPYRSRSGTSDFFGDGDHISPFDQPAPKAPQPEKPSDNGIRNWKVGERAHHEKFGDGTVVEIIDENIIVIMFDNAGKKTLLATHPMLSRLKSEGGEA